MGSLTTGSVLVGRYRLGEPLGSGGSATVYAARDERLDRDVAVKVWDGQGRTARTSDDETRVLATLSHPGVVVVHDAAVQDGVEFLVMERVEGASLSRLLHTGPLDPDRAGRLLAQLAGTLAHLHEQGLVHGDVTPSNVLVAADDHVKLADFGGVRPTGERAEVGTPGYLSPEQLAGEPLSPASDVYALGLVLRACLDGVADVPAGLTALVAETTDPDPVRRPSAAAVAVRLEARGGGQHTLVLPPPSPPPSRSSRLWPAAAALLLAVLLLAITAPDRHEDRGAVVPPPAVPSTATPTASAVETVSPAPPPVVPPEQLVRGRGKSHHGRGRH